MIDTVGWSRPLVKFVGLAHLKFTSDRGLTLTLQQFKTRAFC